METSILRLKGFCPVTCPRVATVEERGGASQRVAAAYDLNYILPSGSGTVVLPAPQRDRPIDPLSHYMLRRRVKPRTLLIQTSTSTASAQAKRIHAKPSKTPKTGSESDKK